MSMWWRSKPPDVTDRSAEIAAAALENASTRQEAEKLRTENWLRFVKVHHITNALLLEGAQNHFTQRIEAALRGHTDDR